MKYREAKNESEYPSGANILTALQSSLEEMQGDGIVDDRILEAVLDQRGTFRSSASASALELDSNDGPDLAMRLYTRLKGSYPKLPSAAAEEAALIMGDAKSGGWSIDKYAAELSNWCKHHVPFEA